MLAGSIATLAGKPAQLAGAAQRQPRFTARFAESGQDIRAAQRLRADVFGAEYGVSFAHPQGLDCDRFDPHCRHLNVFDTRNGQLVATTRLLSGEMVKAPTCQISPARLVRSSPVARSTTRTEWSGPG